MKKTIKTTIVVTVDSLAGLQSTYDHEAETWVVHEDGSLAIRMSDCRTVAQYAAGRWIGVCRRERPC